jgi:autotransporter passenger strand-loop-strand repeat protein
MKSRPATLEVANGGTEIVHSGNACRLLRRAARLALRILSGGAETVSAGGTDLGAQVAGGEQGVFGYAWLKSALI